MKNIVIVMPVYNEESIIVDFLLELDTHFVGTDVAFIVVNDKSSDRTLEVLTAIRLKSNLEIINNLVNLGHGRTLLRGLERALELEYRVVISVDGDGHFRGNDIRNLYDTFLKSSHSEVLLEGVRIMRTEPVYRKFTSAMTRLLVWSRSGTYPKDANTPLRIYSQKTLERLIASLPQSSVIPNLHISCISRRQDLNILEIPISWMNRKGFMESGSSWKPAVKFLPSKRFISFCFMAFREWFGLRISPN